ncbi:MAG: FecR domain-containing protein [Saprospiraceae bacterium]|nr:FecR domain-containing protein [Candidatus Vicinibacter affinis]MBP6173579.1 FecR domain-containing protein [Saprospiraceae bacterium]MBK6821634.1 FecR domain-containing protein [Candidatus Vicinibacter affinis]MBK7302859.1 FecR domain-containing protein [Candidatus Vicinibacter affinis]MBK7695177.1 FecR domain-containing protein [Candidatus Vicinibacter affinis]
MKKDYNNYQMQDFLDDSSFRSWVLDPNPELDAFWSGILQEHPQILQELNLASGFLKELRFKDLNPGPAAQNRLWEKIQAEIPAKRENSMLRKILPWVAAAACMAVLLWVNLKTNESWTTETTQFAQIKEVSLPDGSQVKLNAGSELNFQASKFKSDRILTLKGEAFFNVQKGESFVVKTDLGEVKVLGTSFNVYARGDFMEVSCFTGKVSVKFNKSNTETILTPGQKISNASNSSSTENFVPGESKIWTEGFFYYSDAPLIRVIEELQRQYAISSFEIPSGLENKSYKGFFRKNNLEEAIESICLPLQLKGQIIDKKLYIKKVE